jgi:hypothetical protein
MGASASWNRQGLSRPVMGLLYLLGISSLVLAKLLLGIQKNKNEN